MSFLSFVGCPFFYTEIVNFSPKRGKFKTKAKIGSALLDGFPNNVNHQKTAQAPRGGAEPVCIDQQRIRFRVESGGERFVQRNLQKKRRSPDDER
jgi:hypothetical protein